MQEFLAELKKMNFSAIDARELLGPEHWGWVDDVADRGHFFQTGHKILANRIFESGDEMDVWLQLKSDAKSAAGAQEVAP